jgi:hypothetical protein
MAMPQGDPREVTVPEPHLGWLGHIALFGGPLCGVCIGLGIESLLAGGPNQWRALGIGAAVGGGLGWLTLTSFRRSLGPRSAALRIAELYLIVGLLGDIATKWIGSL